MRVGLSTQFSFTKRLRQHFHSPVSIGKDPHQEESDRVNQILEEERQEALRRAALEDGTTQQFTLPKIDERALIAEAKAAETNRRDKDLRHRSEGSQILLD